MPLIARDNHPKLLRSPVPCRMLRHVPMQNPSGADFENHEDVQESGMWRSRQRRNHSPARTGRGSPRTCSTLVCPDLGRGGRDGMYRRTVRGDNRIPSFTRSSAAIRSSPHVRFAAAIVAISCCRSAGIVGRPGARDFHRQNNRNPFRCQRISVSGFTMTSKWRHSRKRDKLPRMMRVASSARRGFTRRSWYNASCFRRNRFSAASWARDRITDDASDARS